MMELMLMMVVIVVVMVMMSERLPCRGLFCGNYSKDKQLPPQMTSTTLLTCCGGRRKRYQKDKISSQKWPLQC